MVSFRATSCYKLQIVPSPTSNSNLYPVTRTSNLDPRSDEDYAKYVSSSGSAGIFLNMHKHEVTKEAKNKKGVYLSSSCGDSQVRARREHYRTTAV